MTSVTHSKPRRRPKRERGERVLRADARRNREAVIAAAKKLFAEEGLDAQMPDVAHAAKVGVGTVYRHFPTKDDLIAALAEERFARLAEKAEEALEADDAWQGFQDLVQFTVQTQAEDRGLCEVMGSRPDLMAAAAQAVDLDVLYDRVVKRVQREGMLRRDLDWQDIPMISCALGGVTNAQGPGAGRWPRLVEIVLDGLRPENASKLPKPL